MSSNTTVLQTIDGVLDPDGVIRCHGLGFSTEEDRANVWCGVGAPGCMDPTVLQALADESVLSLQISSESGRGDPRNEFSWEVQRFVGGQRANRASTRFESDGEVSEETRMRFATRHTSRAGGL
jgi:hypothetical protein